MTSRTSSSTEHKNKNLTSPDIRPRAGFFVRQRELAKRRLWPIALSFLAYLLYNVIGVATAMHVAAQNAAARQSAAVLRTQSLQDTMSGLLGSDSVSWAFIALPLAALLAIEGFAWMDNRKEVDFYESLPVPRIQRFTDICVGSFMYFVFSYLITLEIGLVIGRASGALTHPILLDIFMTAVKTIALFLAVYALGVLSTMLTGNVIVAWLAFFVLLFYEMIFRAMLSGFGSEFFATWSGHPSKLMSRSLFSPIEYFIREGSGPLGRFESPVFLLLLAAVFFVLSLAAYRLRKNERAETAVIFTPVRTVVRIAIAVIVGLFPGLFFSSLWMNRGMIVVVIWMLLFTVITACIMQIIYEYDFLALFHRPLEIAAAAAITLLIFLVFAFDLTGYDRFVPDPDQVADAAMIYIDNQADKRTDEGKNVLDEEYGDLYMKLDNVEDIVSVAQYGQEYTRQNFLLENEIHEESDEKNEEKFSFLVKYNMKNGSTIYRSFTLPATIDPAMMDAVTGTQGFREGTFNIYHDKPARSSRQNLTIGCMNGINGKSNTITTDQYEVFRNTYIAELSGFSYSFARANRPVAKVEISIPGLSLDFTSYDHMNNGDYIITLPIYSSFSNTIRVLQDYNVWLEPVDYDSIPRGDYDSLSREDRDYLDSLDSSVFAGPFNFRIDF